MGLVDFFSKAALKMQLFVVEDELTIGTSTTSVTVHYLKSRDKPTKKGIHRIYGTPHSSAPN